MCDSSHSESETKRLHIDHSTRDVVMLLDDSDVCQAVEQCREVCRRRETFLVDVNDWNCDFRDKLRACGPDGTTVACSSGGTPREFMSNESCLLDLLAAARDGNGNLQRKPWEVCSTTRTWHPGGSWALRRIRPGFGSSLQDGGERLHRQNVSL